MINKKGLRWRIAIMYLSVFAAAFLIFCSWLYQSFQKNQIRAFDSTLYNFAVDISSNLEMDFVGRLFVLNSGFSDAGKFFPFHLGSSFFEILDSRGKVLLRSRSLGEQRLPIDIKTIKILPDQRAIFRTINIAGLGVQSSSPELRLLSFWTVHPGWREPLILQIAVPLDLLRQERRDLLTFFSIAIPVLLLVAGLIGFWMSAFALKPVHLITQKARDITGVEKLSERIPVPEAKDEIHELAQTFNSLLDRLERAFMSQDRFVANASHQLKTPLTILKGEVERLRKIRDSGAGHELQEGLDSVASEINRLIKLVQDLLMLARLEAGRDSIELKPVSLDETLLMAVARVQKMAQGRGIQIRTQLESEGQEEAVGVSISGDEELIDSMIENFLENAVKYSPDGEPIDVEMKTRLKGAEIRIRDRGPGIAPDLQQKIFERFSRGQPSSETPGSGLGLAIAAEIARLHGVNVKVKAPSQGTGTVVSLDFHRT